jgi:ppGpp synthetase/RelA/SpoT-type nucleotidyltranferase
MGILAEDLPNYEVASYNDDPAIVPWETMAWSVPRFSRNQVDTAGDYLIHTDFFVEELPYSVDQVMKIVNNWRSSHNWPLYIIRKTLENRAKSIAPSAFVAQRIKRLFSIMEKLQHNRDRHLKLSRIQDIGGCRAVMPTIGDALALVKTYKEEGIQSEFVRDNDYILEPKKDGYRSVHLVYKYQSDSAQYSVFNNRRIEIQIRSQLQHAWATAVETVTTFDNMPIRSKPSDEFVPQKNRLDSWQRFFALMGTAIAIRENQPIVPGTPADDTELVKELRFLGDYLRVKHLLTTWNTLALQLPAKEASGAYFYLMRLYPEKKTLIVSTFKSTEGQRAFDALNAAEREEKASPLVQVALVGGNSLDTLRKAYPNYYADTVAFLEAFETATR